MATSTSSIGGLVSGLDTATIISQLMAVAGQPQALLKSQLSATTARTTAAQAINAKAASMTSLAKDLASTTTFTTATASSSSPAVTTAVTGSPAATSISFSVTALAAAASYATGALTFPTSVTAADTFTITRGGQTYTIAKQTSASALVAAVNASAAGVYATVVTDAATSAQRLVVTAKDTGADATLAVSGLDNGGGAQLSAGRNATVDLGGVTVSSTSNTFTHLIEGVSVTLGAGSDSPTAGLVTVSTAVSSSAISSKVTGVVTAMNAVLSDIAFHTKLPPAGTAASATTGGLLAGQSDFRTLAGNLLDTVSASVGANAAVQAGLAVTRDGQVTFDATKFQALYASDPATAQRVLTAFGTAVQTAGTGASDATSGTITSFINGGTDTAKQLTDRISDWNDRLAVKKDRLNAQYAALETALSKLKSQSDALSQALSGLPAN